MPQASLGADIIVGFPEETAEDFSLLHDFLQASPLTYIHVFPYSPRLNTPAARMPQVPEAVKKERASVLRTLAAKKNLQFRRSFLGHKLEGIVIKRKDGRAEVLTDNYLKILVPAGGMIKRQRLEVRINSVSEQETGGEIVVSPQL